MDGPRNLNTRVVEITTGYLGPAADRFISRQIRNHLNKSPEKLLQEDLKELIDWIEVAMAFLTSDESLINRYIKDLRKLSLRESSSNDHPLRRTH